MSDILWFNDANGATVSLVGGKGANLSLLTRAGFDVPPGFTIAAGAYSAFLHNSGLDARIGKVLADLNYKDTEALDRGTETIRQMICATELPTAIAEQIRSAYARLGADPYVAVRSSGVAEDMEGASFAGLHDTYLDIRGEASLLDAVRRCWASLWTARATSYRQTKGFNHLESPIALVVQTMVEADVAGVIFTGNPMNAATDEIVINASWGLGEAIVGGITTPDDFVVKSGTLNIIERRLGAKEVRVVRDAKNGNGTVTLPNDALAQGQYSLTDEQVKALAAVALRIQAHYEDFPQDIEWCLAGGKFYVLQSRPVTGVEFTWDADVTASCPGDDTESDTTVWSHTFAAEVWTGAVTPLMFSWRATVNSIGLSHVYNLIGHGELAHTSMRHFKYHKSSPYFNATVDKGFMEKLVPPAFRAVMIGRLPTTWHEEVLKTPFDYLGYLKYYYQHLLAVPSENLAWPETLDAVMADQAAVERMNGLSDAQLQQLSDAELKQYIDDTIDMEGKFYDVVIFGLNYYFRDGLGLLSWMITNWYDGDNPGAMADVVTGTRRQTITAIENLALWSLAQRIQTSPALLAKFKQHPGAEFFARAKEDEEGRGFLAEYATFLHDHGHRGHDDRDIYYLRRAEDPAVDYRALMTILSVSSGLDPETRERQVNERREAVVDAVAANIAGKPDGELKAKAFREVVDYMHKCFRGRDNERHFVDRSTFAIKKGFIEVNRRLSERGLLDGGRDFYFLARPELYEVLDGHANLKLCKAKIAARMRDFDAVYSKEVTPAQYLVRDRSVDLDAPIVHDGDGVFRGAGTSRGKITGKARVIKNLKDIGRVQQGEILVTNSTDPGWTPVFMVISGIVLETGGMLAHGALLAREYGFPAVQIAGAMKFIPDGATISIDGDAGVVVIESVPEETELAVA